MLMLRATEQNLLKLFEGIINGEIGAFTQLPRTDKGPTNVIH